MTVVHFTDITSVCNCNSLNYNQFLTIYLALTILPMSIDDLGMFRAARYRTNKSHVRAYHRIVEISAPAEDHDDQNALYALRVDLEVSCGWPANKRMRLLAMNEMKRLLEKHPHGLDGYVGPKDEKS